MKKQIAKSIPILSLLALLSVVPVNVYATGGTCSVPSCRPKQNIAAPAITPDVTRLPKPELYEQETSITEQTPDRFDFDYFLAGWAVRFLYLL
jgi:hypothetical protein